MMYSIYIHGKAASYPKKGKFPFCTMMYSIYIHGKAASYPKKGKFPFCTMMYSIYIHGKAASYPKKGKFPCRFVTRNREALLTDCSWPQGKSLDFKYLGG
jgi:hypothetical protein